jgi:hypothetical protein
MNKRYDAFFSYSSKDRRFASRLAADLATSGLAVWFDDWEMRPGDRLRDRINHGIGRARYFLVALTPESVQAAWVRHELDAAMLRELEEKRVVVIPLLYGDLSAADLPTDLRGKHYLDFRGRGKYRKSLQRLLAIFDLQKRHRRAQMVLLRRGDDRSPAAVAQLRVLATTGRDQTVQKAALSGLANCATSDATVAIAERLLNTWGMNAIKHAIQCSAKAAADGGLLVLAFDLVP